MYWHAFVRLERNYFYICTTKNAFPVRRHCESVLVVYRWPRWFLRIPSIVGTQSFKVLVLTWQWCSKALREHRGMTEDRYCQLRHSVCLSCSKIKFTRLNWGYHFLLITSQTLPLAAAKKRLSSTVLTLTTGTCFPQVAFFAGWFFSHLHPDHRGRATCWSV